VYRVITSYLSKVADFILSHAPRFVAPVTSDVFKFRGDLRRQKTRVFGLSCGVVCDLMFSPIDTYYRHVTDGQTERQSDKETDRRTYTTTANTALASRGKKESKQKCNDFLSKSEHFTG